MSIALLCGSMLLVLYFAAIAFTAVGLQCYRPWKPPAQSRGLELLTAYVIGACLFLSADRVLSEVLGVRSAVLVLLLIGLFAIYREGRGLLGYLKQPRTWLVFLTALTIQLFCFLFWTRDLVETAFSSTGSGHAPRYSNLVLYLMQTDRIPVVGQNYGQSLLATLHSLAGLNSPLFALNLWLGLHVFLLAALAYGLLRAAKFSCLTAVMGSMGVMLGNTALSRQHVMVIDSLSPMLINGYSDSLLSIGSLLAAFLLTHAGLSQAVTQPSYRLRYGLMLVAIFFSWSMTGAQNYYLYAVGFLVIYAWHFPSLARRYYRLLGYLVLGLISLLLARRLGGMLVDKALVETLPFGGMMIVSKPGIPLIALELGTPQVVGSFSYWRPGILLTDSVLRQWLTSLQAIFWPLLGVLGALLANRKSMSSPDARMNSYISASVFFAGLSIVLPFAIYGAKWEVSRFMLPGYFVGSVWLMIGVKRLSERYALTANQRVMSIGFGTALLVLVYGGGPGVILATSWICAFVGANAQLNGLKGKELKSIKSMMSCFAIGTLALVLIYGPVRSIREGMRMVPTLQDKWERIQTVLYFSHFVIRIK